MTTSTQKALVLDAKFGNFTVDNISIPEPGPGEILVKVKTAGLNPADWKAHKGLVAVTFPAILGADVSGDVEELGEGVSDFKKGDRVVFQGQFGGKYAGFQQYALVAAAVTAKIPSNISYDEASTLPTAFATAYVGLYNSNPNGIGLVSPVTPEGRGKYAGQPFVILGGSSSVGQNVIQLAKLSGFSPIITTASVKHARSLKSIGATHVIDRNISPSALASEVASISQNAPLKYAADSISLADTQQVGYDLLAPGGRLATFLPAAVKTTEEKHIFSAIGVISYPSNVELLRTLFHDNFERLLKDGDIKPNRVEVLPDGLAGIPDGLKQLESNQVSRSKLVVHPEKTA